VIEMAEEDITKNKKEGKKPGIVGFSLAIVGAVLILVDGILALVTGNNYMWSVVSASVTGYIEIALSVVMLGISPFYKRSPPAIGWTIFGLAVITLVFDGGFYWVGAILALIGGALIALRK
jgi:hypothetical protein